MFALCNETRIHSSEAPDGSGVEQEKPNAIIKDKHILLFDPAVPGDLRHALRHKTS